MTDYRRSIRCASLGIVLFGMVGTASAEGKFKKKELEVQGTAQTTLTKPKEPPKEQKQTGPVLTVDQFVGQQQSKILKIVDKQIDQLRRLLKITPNDDPQKPDYLFRLGELYSEKQRYFSLHSRSFDEKIFQAEQKKNTSLAAKLKKEQKDDEKAAETWSNEAIKHYVEATKYNKYERMDEVLFRLAYLLQMIKKDDKAREFFHRLIKDYPQSKYVPNAYLSFAEYFFGKGEMENALKFYEKVEQFPKSEVYGFAVYKKGWAQINLGRFQDALKIFVNVIELCHAKKISAAQRGPLEKEAKKDLVKAYARTPGVRA